MASAANKPRRLGVPAAAVAAAVAAHAASAACETAAAPAAVSPPWSATLALAALALAAAAAAAKPPSPAAALRLQAVVEPAKRLWLRRLRRPERLPRAIVRWRSSVVRAGDHALCGGRRWDRPLPLRPAASAAASASAGVAAPAAVRVRRGVELSVGLAVLHLM